MVDVQRLSLRLDNGTIVSCCTRYGVTEEKNAVVIPYQEGFKKGFVSQADLDRMGKYVAMLDAAWTPRAELAPKRKSVPLDSSPAVPAKKQKVAPSPATPAAPARKFGVEWYKDALKIHNTITTDPRSKIFREPVAPRMAPDYTVIVKQPMDLRTIKKKLSGYAYAGGPQAFADDMSLMFSNCLLYNGALNEYGQAGIIMNKEWQQLWAKTGLGQAAEAQTQSRSRSKRQTAGHAPLKWEPDVQQVSEPRRSKGGSKAGLQREKSVNAGRRNSVLQAQAQPKARPEMSEERKELLGAALEAMDDAAMDGIMGILRTTSAYSQAEDDEIELDLEALSSVELWQLDDFAKANSRGAYDPDAGVRAGAQPKQRGPVIENLSDEETDDDM